MIIYCLFIWTNLNPHHPRMFCANFGWNRPSGSREDENVKSLRQQQRRQWRRRKTDKFWSEKLTWSIGSVELKINNYFNPSMGLIRRWWTTIILSQMWQNISVTDVPAIVVFFWDTTIYIFNKPKFKITRSWTTSHCSYEHNTNNVRILTFSQLC